MRRIGNHIFFNGLYYCAWGNGLFALTGEAGDFKGLGAGKVPRHQLEHRW